MRRRSCLLISSILLIFPPSSTVVGASSPTNLQFSDVTSGCLTFSWNSPGGGAVSEYQYTCGDTSVWQSVGLNLTVTECGFLPGAVVECSVRAGNDVSSAVSESMTTCSEALPVEELNRGSPSKVTGSGRIRWNYFISWQAPPSYGCIHSTSPYKLQIDDTVIDDYNLTSYTLYADGNIPLSITVWLRNTGEDLSPPTSLSFKTSAGLPPQVAPINFSLTSSSSSCVSLSWEPVRYPNGPVNTIRYQVNCGSAGWAYVSTDNKVCNFEPYFLVECQLRAKSGDRTSNVTAASGRTACGIPFMTSFSADFAVDNENGQEKIHLLVNWLPAVSLCETLSYYNITVIDLNSRLIFHNQYDVNAQRDAQITENLEPWTTYVVSMIAVNSQGNQSESVSQEIASPELKPSTKPSISLRFEDDCVYVTLGPPSQPNGAILYYQYGCDYLSTFTANTFGEQKVNLYSDRDYLFSVPADVCGLGWRPVSKIKCAATAHTSGGSSPEASETGYTIAQVSAVLKFFFHGVGGVTVTVHYSCPVPDSNGHVNIRSIVIVVGPTNGARCETAPLVNHSYAIQNNLSCYATAEIVYSSDSRANYIYTNFELGNGEYVGKYYNAPLKLWSLYTVYAVLDMYSEVEEESVIQFIEKHTISDVNVKIAVGVSMAVLGLIIIITIIATHYQAICAIKCPGKRKIKREDIVDQTELPTTRQFDIESGEPRTEQVEEAANDEEDEVEGEEDENVEEEQEEGEEEEDVEEEQEEGEEEEEEEPTAFVSTSQTSATSGVIPSAPPLSEIEKNEAKKTKHNRRVLKYYREQPPPPYHEVMAKMGKAMSSAAHHQQQSSNESVDLDDEDSDDEDTDDEDSDDEGGMYGK